MILRLHFILLMLTPHSLEECTIFSTSFSCSNVNQKELLFEFNSKISNEDNITAIEIVHSNLSEIGSFLDPVDTPVKESITRIKLSYCEIQKIEENAFISFSNLHILDLSSNKIKEVTFIKSLPGKLLEISLRNNTLTEVGDVFEKLKDIRIVDLSNCQIDNFDFTIFANNLELKMVNISNNNLHNAESKEFLKNVECVDISNNDLSKHSNIPSYCLDFSFTNTTGYYWYNVSDKNSTVYVSKFLYVGNNKLQLFAINKKKEPLNIEVKYLNISMFKSKINELNLTKVKVRNELNLRGSVIPQLTKLDYDLKLLFYDEGTNTTLDLSNCSIADISNNYFMEYSLGKLNLCYNVFKKVEAGTFNNAYIIDLELCHGDIENIEANAFEGLHSKKLNLSYNNLNEINFLENLKSLYILDLSNNKIQALGSNVFSKLNDLETLDISSNLLREIDATAFSLNKIKVINLKNNNLASINSGIFKDIPNLEYLYLQRNPVVIIDSNSFKNLSSLKELSLSDMAIETIKPEAFIGLKELKQLDISNNRISVIANDVFVEVPNLQELYLDKNPVAILETNGLNLKTLKLTMDQKFQCSSLSLSKLQTLYIMNSVIDTICGSKLDNLVILNLDDVHINNVNENTLQGLYNVRNLNEQVLFKNVRILRKDTFRDTKSVSNLDLSGLNLQIIEPLSFSGMVNLEKLSISNNVLTELRKCSFCGLKSVWYVNLSQNKISKIYQNAFQEVDNIAFLSLADNNIFDIPVKLFQNLRQLTILDLSKNNIEKLQDDTFYGLSILKVLDISKNKLYAIDKNVLNSLVNIEHINLEDNHLTNNEFLLNLKVTSNLQYVNMYGNEWSCEDINIITRDLTENGITVFKNTCVSKTVLLI